MVSSANFHWNSFRASYRLMQALWIGCSAVYLIIFLFVADIASDRTHGLLLASTFLLQAIFVPAYIWRANFATRVEAVIRSVAPGAALSGLTATLYLLPTAVHLGGNAYEYFRLPIDYVSTILFLVGLASGIQLGLLRWGALQWAAAFPNSAIPCPAWRRYIKSAVLWIASMMVCAWGVASFPGVHAADALAYFGTVMAGPGLLVIAPISVIFPADPSASLGKRVWKYWLNSLRVLFGLLVLCVIPIALRVPLDLLRTIDLLAGLWILSLLWAFLSGLAEQPNT